MACAYTKINQKKKQPKTWEISKRPSNSHQNNNGQQK